MSTKDEVEMVTEAAHEAIAARADELLVTRAERIDAFWKAAIASGAIIPPPGPVSRPLGTIWAWLALGASLVLLCVLGFLWGLWRA